MHSQRALLEAVLSGAEVTGFGMCVVVHTQHGVMKVHHYSGIM
jgi:hypothetical protein